jgi:hypothetical protein
MILDMKKIFLALVASLCFTFAAMAADVSGKWTADIPGRGGNTQTTTFTYYQHARRQPDLRRQG